jgi:hypothetical protein
VNPGDLVKKTGGDLDLNEVGIIIEFYTNSAGHPLAKVLSAGQVKVWPGHLVEKYFENVKNHPKCGII